MFAAAMTRAWSAAKLTTTSVLFQASALGAGSTLATGALGLLLSILSVLVTAPAGTVLPALSVNSGLATSTANTQPQAHPSNQQPTTQSMMTLRLSSPWSATNWNRTWNQLS